MAHYTWAGWTVCCWWPGFSGTMYHTKQKDKYDMCSKCNCSISFSLFVASHFCGVQTELDETWHYVNWGKKKVTGECKEKITAKKREWKNHSRGKGRKRAMNTQAAEKHCGQLQCDESPVGNTHTHTHKYTHAHKHTHPHTSTQTHKHTHAHTHTESYLYIYIYIYIYVNYFLH